jgi:hypothetical protein
MACQCVLDSIGSPYCLHFHIRYIVEVKAAGALVPIYQTTGCTPEYCNNEGEILYFLMRLMYLLFVISSFSTIRQCSRTRGCKFFFVYHVTFDVRMNPNEQRQA